VTKEKKNQGKKRGGATAAEHSSSRFPRGKNIREKKRGKQLFVPPNRAKKGGTEREKRQERNFCTYILLKVREQAEEEGPEEREEKGRCNSSQILMSVSSNEERRKKREGNGERKEKERRRNGNFELALGLGLITRSYHGTSGGGEKRKKMSKEKKKSDKSIGYFVLTHYHEGQEEGGKTEKGKGKGPSDLIVALSLEHFLKIESPKRGREG